MRILVGLAILFSCQLHAQDADKSKSKAPSAEEYIIKKDSTIVAGKVTYKKGKVILDGTEYEPGELLGFKDGKDYRAVIGDAIYYVWTLGKIQAYSYWQTVTNAPTTYNRRTNTMEYHQQTSSKCVLRKSDGGFVPYTSQHLFDLVKDNEAAVKEFHVQYKKINTWVPMDALYRRLRKVLEVYNGGEIKEPAL